MKWFVRKNKIDLQAKEFLQFLLILARKNEQK